jgi:TRAP-type C4-dicarboxylate transport system substrate-binding protein
MLYFKLTLIFVLFISAFSEHDAFKPFWKNLSPDQQKEVSEALKDVSMTKADMMKKLENLVNKFGNETIKVNPFL